MIIILEPKSYTVVYYGAVMKLKSSEIANNRDVTSIKLFGRFYDTSKVRFVLLW